MNFRQSESLPEVRFRILGQLAVHGRGGAVDGGPRKQRIVLAALLCHANSVVSVDALAEALWLGSPPRTARKNIQVYLSTLRGMTPADGGLRISHQAGGYVLHVDPGEVDALRFAQLVREAARLRRAASSAAVAQALAAALG
ncbi:MAG: AfsR family transcriptional regulator, partial [Catenulispora sp.]|nr:AfsR family transcriptional regulator [Catenulispora sp.]